MRFLICLLVLCWGRALVSGPLPYHKNREFRPNKCHTQEQYRLLRADLKREFESLTTNSSYREAALENLSSPEKGEDRDPIITLRAFILGCWFTNMKGKDVRNWQDQRLEVWYGTDKNGQINGDGFCWQSFLEKERKIADRCLSSKHSVFFSPKKGAELLWTVGGSTTSRERGKGTVTHGSDTKEKAFRTVVIDFFHNGNKETPLHKALWKRYNRATLPVGGGMEGGVITPDSHLNTWKHKPSDDEVKTAWEKLGFSQEEVS